MNRVKANNVNVIGVEGSTCDDLDVIASKILKEKKFVEEYGLNSINSINWTRICVQIAHYFYSYFHVCDYLNEKVQFCNSTHSFYPTYVCT